MEILKRKCYICHNEFPLESGFYRNKNKPLGYAYDCKKCRQAKKEELNAKNPIRHLKKTLDARIALWKKEHVNPPSISFEEFLDLIDKSGGHCAICKRPEGQERGLKLRIDHDHKTNRIRGMLCNPCNLALGLFQDDRDRLKAAVSYLS
jgi:hypothetical protein